MPFIRQCSRYLEIKPSVSQPTYEGSPSSFLNVVLFATLIPTQSRDVPM